MVRSWPGLHNTSPISQPALTQATLSFICASSAVPTCKKKAEAGTLRLYLCIRGDITLSSIRIKIFLGILCVFLFGGFAFMCPCIGEFQRERECVMQIVWIFGAMYSVLKNQYLWTKSTLLLQGVVYDRGTNPLTGIHLSVWFRYTIQCAWRPVGYF